MSTVDDELIRLRVKEFAANVRVDGAESPRGRAAVAVCVSGDEVLLMRRAARGRNAGQWAFPGGRAEKGEDAVTTALRETSEELGLTLAETDVAGRLDDFRAESGFVITPVVVIVPGNPVLTPNYEVESVHSVSLQRLSEPDLPRYVTQPDGRQLLQMPLGAGMTIHAPTGAILYQFREVALFGRPTRVFDVVQPDWTRH
jgi:8-oxo-dGTP pyrophosphatase MutT (NUDIX family)